MLKQGFKLGILFIVLGSILFGIYKNPELILTEDTQTQLLEVAEKIDNELNKLQTEEDVVELVETIDKEVTE